MGVVVNLTDRNVRTPEQVLRVFFRTFSTGAVRLELLKVFARVSVANEVDGINSFEGLEDIAELFDQLLALINAVEVMLEHPPDQCPVCKRRVDGFGDAG